MKDKELFKNKYRIESSRLYGYDYSWPGFYFITICTKDRECFFGEINNNKVQLSKVGKIASKFWFKIPKHFLFVKLDEFIVMPNHIHGILIINNNNNVETQDFASLPINYNSLRRHNKFIPQTKNLSSIVRGYKSSLKKYAIINKIEFNWQSRFYDRIIRNKKELDDIQNYIKNNPDNWHNDRNNIY